MTIGVVVGIRCSIVIYVVVVGVDIDSGSGDGSYIVANIDVDSVYISCVVAHVVVVLDDFAVLGVVVVALLGVCSVMIGYDVGCDGVVVGVDVVDVGDVCDDVVGCADRVDVAMIVDSVGVVDVVVLHVFVVRVRCVLIMELVLHMW